MIAKFRRVHNDRFQNLMEFLQSKNNIVTLEDVTAHDIDSLPGEEILVGTDNGCPVLFVRVVSVKPQHDFDGLTWQIELEIADEVCVGSFKMPGRMNESLDTECPVSPRRVVNLIFDILGS